MTSRVSAFIPARGGSERVRSKNLQLIDGVPLVGHAIDHAMEATVDEIVVSTDDEDIANYARWRGVAVHERPEHISRNESQIEPAIAHWLNREPAELRTDLVVMLQPTSPLRDPQSVRACIDRVQSGDFDTCCTVARMAQLGFSGRAKPIDHGFEFRRDAPVDWRPRTQALPQRVYEDGAVYAFTREHFLRNKCRLGGRMACVPCRPMGSVGHRHGSGPRARSADGEGLFMSDENLTWEEGEPMEIAVLITVGDEMGRGPSGGDRR